jgi:hypothetical protein
MSVAASPADRAIVSRPIDLACVGGISIVAVVLLLALPLPPLSKLGIGWVLALQALVNWPHFMASYALLYSSPDTVRKYRVAALWFPAALGAYAIFASIVWLRHPIHADLIQWAAALYLGRHYTGQTWGMMASFGHIDGVRFAARERLLVRTGLNLMMLWHMSWAAANVSTTLAPSIAGTCREIYQHMAVVGWASLALSAGGLVLLGLRLRRLPPARVLVPWAALYLWYLLLAMDSSAALVAQLAHALQYLIFPIRVEANRAHAALGRIAWRRLALWVLFGFVVFAGLPGLFAMIYKTSGGGARIDELVTALVAATVAVHHYFVDGTLYKLRNPEVRQALFAHLAGAASTSAEARAA